jgi:hypothetical protein
MLKVDLQEVKHFFGLARERLFGLLVPIYFPQETASIL